jgi:hypothetical protein
LLVPVMPLRQILTAAGTCLVVTGFFYLFGLGPTTYERTFDQNLAHFPLAASRAQRDPGLRDIFLRKTEAAFDRGGWRAANGALMMSMVTDVETFADDEHINAISRSTMAVLLKLRDNPAACKQFLLVGAETDELPDAKAEIEQSWHADLAAAEDGFSRRMSGVKWATPSDSQILNVERYLRRAPVATLTQAEIEAEAKYPDGDAELICSARIKKAALSPRDAAYPQRVMMSNTGNIDIAAALRKLCRENKDATACS